VDLRIPAAQFRDVRIEARLIEPAEHLVELPAEEQAYPWHGQLLEFHRLAKNASEDLGRFGIGQFAARDFGALLP